MRKLIVSLSLVAAGVTGAASGASALQVAPGGTGCPLDATTCVPASPLPPKPKPPKPQPGTGLQECTVYSDGTVVCTPIAPLQD